MVIYLLLNGNYSPVPGMLEAGKSWRLSPLFNPESLEAVSVNELKIVVCEDGNTGNHWKQYATIARKINSNVFFILITAYENPAEAYQGGADLIVSPSDKAGLNAAINEFIRRQTLLETPDNLRRHELKKDVLDEMQKKNQELEKVNFELDRFVHSVSHDLRSPLTSILGLLYLLREEISNEGTLHYIKMMEDSILKLDNTIKDIVAYSRNKNQDIVSEPIDLQELVSEILSGLRYLETDEFALHDIIKIDPVAIFYTDGNRLRVILNNLLANSIRYHQPGKKPQVNIQCTVSGNQIHLTVEDNGIGISERHLDRIFDMFYRSNESSTGSGLGLYIVKETIKKMGGTIEVQSELGKGSRFIISMPQIPVELKKPESL